jgi:hypothetical protein
MLSSNMLLLNLILLIDVTFSTPTPVFNSSLADGPPRTYNRLAILLGRRASS